MPVVIAIGGKDPIPQYPVRGIDIHIRVFRQKCLILIIVQVMEHGSVFHVVAIYHSIEIGKIRSVFLFGVNAARIPPGTVQIMVQVVGVVRWMLQHGIVNPGARNGDPGVNVGVGFLLERSEIHSAQKSLVIRDIPDDEALLRTVDFTALQEETNAHIYAWISIPGTRIDYPMLQHPSDNTHYLNHNLDGSRGYPGCIYTEKENAADFSDFNTVIYGHNMKNGSMFHDLHNYEDETFLPEHPYVYIYTPDRVLRYRIFASYRYDDRHLLYSFDYATEEGRSGYLKEIRGIRSMSAVLDDQVEVTAQDRLVTLSTCVSGRAENRYLVQAVLVDDIPVSDINDLLIYTTMGQ